MTKSVGLRIRVEPWLRDAFVQACQTRDMSAAQVLRAFMRGYVDKQPESKQGQLFPDIDFRTDKGLLKVKK